MPESQVMVLRDSQRWPHLIDGLHDLMRFVGPVDTMVEVGVFSGESCQVFSQYAKRIYAIDPWVGNYDENDMTSNLDMTAAWQVMIERQYQCPVLPVRAFSPQIADWFDFVDMVYIDGNHTYKGVKADIIAWRPKCRILAGHDYNYQGHPGVKKAVDEVFSKPKKVFRDSSWVV